MGEKISFIDLFGTELEIEDEYAREQLSGEAAARAEDVAVLSARMDTFTALPAGSTAGDAELTDIRVGADGNTYANAGDAVRSIGNKLHNTVKADIEVDIGYNRYVDENGKVVEGTVASRASTKVLPATFKTLYVVPANGYRVSVGGLISNGSPTSGDWAYVETQATEPVLVSLDGYSAFFIQILADFNIPSDAEPIKVFYNIDKEITEINSTFSEVIFSVPVDVDVGMARNVTNGNLVTSVNTTRASCEPFTPPYDKARVITAENVYVNVNTEVGGVWSETSWRQGNIDIDLTNIDRLCFNFQLKNNAVIPQNFDFGAFLCLAPTTEKLISLDSTINGLLKDINNENLWEIGSLGSAGENYDARNYEIRTADYLDITTVAVIKIDQTATARYCLYDENKSFLYRQYTQHGDIIKADLWKVYPNAKYIRVCLFTDETPVVNVSNYVFCKIMALPIQTEPTRDEEVAHYNDLLSQARYSYTDADSGIDTSPRVLTLLHFSDVHGNLPAMKYAMNIYDTYSNKIDDIIHTGDAVVANFSDGLTNWISSGCAESVLNVIGNHDTEENFVLQAAGKDNVYNAFFAPYIENWGVVQPTGVDTSSSPNYHALYYYKDYTAPKIRLIVLDTNFWDTAETDWLSDTLADAKTNEYAVILACHDVKHLTEMLDSNFSAYKGDGINENTNAYANQPADWLDPVDDFIADGGEFICMLAGHNHSGHMGTITNYQDVFCFVSDKASMSRVTGTNRVNGEDNQNTVNIVTVNAKEKLFKIVKIGAEVDGKMRGKHVFCYDYANKQIISQW